MPSAADWITLSEAAEILAAANIHFRPATIGAGRGRAACPASSSAAGGTSVAARSRRSGRGAAAGPRRGHPARAVRGAERLSA